MDLRQVGYDDGDWINLAQDRDRWRAYESVRIITAFLCETLTTKYRAILGCVRCYDVDLVTFMKLTDARYAIRKAQDNREGLELNGLHHLLVYANDLNMLGENPQMIRKNSGILLEARKEIGLEVNPEKTKAEMQNRQERGESMGKALVPRPQFTGIEWCLYDSYAVT
ncbi:hypothetical protein ANN_01106 [Periplaneta americana]|uniref:Reverse transcriptase domain-containing protein n=1 Tax=Periplaneta americana TaxID=6978 RepID=A0ABQ8TVK1_PERAM|nr:hypothetical protein ANN_01106 [Periplaneta americana]